MKKFLNSEVFWFFLFMGIVTSLMWTRMSSHYDKVLEGTKYQVHKKDYRPGK